MWLCKFLRCSDLFIVFVVVYEFFVCVGCFFGILIMCIIVIYECVIFVFCYVDLVILFGGLMMSVVVVVIDVVCGGCLVMGYGYVLIGCFV